MTPTLSATFLDELLDAGHDVFAGVPCSFLTPFIDEVIASPRAAYIGATSEGEAGAIAAGAWLAGRSPVVLLQNSGLGNLVNPLTSLHHPFRIPMLMIVTWRGEPGTADEPQHAVMGAVMHPLLDLLGVRHAALPHDRADRLTLLAEAHRHMDATGLPFALVVRQGDLSGRAPARPSTGAAPGSAVERVATTGACPSRYEALARIDGVLPEDVVVIATTGKTGRELFTLADRDRHFYVVGSMGCASAIGLGIALAARHRVLVIDGDGAALMKLGNLATIGAQRPDNLIHVVLDNGVHDSTGGQATAAASVDFAAFAAAAGYARCGSCADADGLSALLAGALAQPGPSFVHARIAPGSSPHLGRPTVPPAAVARRFRAFLAGAENLAEAMAGTEARRALAEA